MSKSNVNKTALPVFMGIVYVNTCHLAYLQAYVVLKIVCGSFLHKRKTILKHIFEIQNVTLTRQINSSFIFLAIYMCSGDNKSNRPTDKSKTPE